MRRAVRILPLLGLMLLCASAPLSAQTIVNQINAIGLIDYMNPPRFKVGDWVVYQVQGGSEMGMVDDYKVTILISGEERLWGEDCFWVETWTEPKNQPVAAVATLMSYSAFGDSLWLQRLKLYARKTVSDMDEDGRPIVQLLRRPSEFRKRDLMKRDVTVARESLGRDTVITPMGTFDVVKSTLRQGVGATADKGDSTQRTEVREEHFIYYSPKIPITGIAREDVESSRMQRSWKVGEADGGKATLNTVERGRVVSRLIAYGSGGITPSMTPEAMRKPIARAATTKPAKPRRSG